MSAPKNGRVKRPRPAAKKKKPDQAPEVLEPEAPDAPVTSPAKTAPLGTPENPIGAGAGGAVATLTAAPRANPTTTLPCFWLTRDRIGGVLMEVDVWAIEPARVEFDDHDVMWLKPEMAVEVRERGRDGGTANRAAQALATYQSARLRAVDHEACIDAWTVAEAHKKVGPGTPDTDRECLRVGDREPLDRSRLS